MSNASHKIVRQSLPDTVVDDLRERILNLDFEEGAQIRQELIAEQYNVSRMPVREALRRLESEGLVVFHTNKGATVTKYSEDEISEMFDLRVLLEVDTLRYALPNMTENSFLRMEVVLEQLENAYHIGDVKRWGALNSKFHACLLDAADRPQTKKIIQNINHLTDRYIRLQLILTGALKDAEREHRELFELCKAGDLEGASYLLGHHIRTAKSGLLAAVRERRTSRLPD